MRSQLAKPFLFCAIALAAAAAIASRAYPRPHVVEAHDMKGHMTMTVLRPVQPGDQDRAATVLAAARQFADNYKDYRKALADGYEIFHPEIPQHVYHFTNNKAAIETTLRFDPAKPTSLLYEKTGSGYKLVGVMYTAPFRASETELDRRVPLSIAQWHVHSNFCLPPAGSRADLLSKDGKFGMNGSISTPEACHEAGGTFIPHVFGWMVHVYPFETDPAKIWATGDDDEHGMQHDGMAGMKM
jgi:hypothetical protein